MLSAGSRRPEGPWNEATLTNVTRFREPILVPQAFQAREVRLVFTHGRHDLHMHRGTNDCLAPESSSGRVVHDLHRLNGAGHE